MSKHLSQKELLDMLALTKEQIVVGSVYTHYKNKDYEVIDIVILESNDQPCVIYEALYGSNIRFARAAANWLEAISINGDKIKRFTLKK